jgi:hypothetical protein
VKLVYGIYIVATRALCRQPVIRVKLPCIRKSNKKFNVLIFPLIFFFNWSFFRFLPFKFKSIPLFISGTPVMKSINEVPLNLTGTVFGITGNLLSFIRNGICITKFN